MALTLRRYLAIVGSCQCDDVARRTYIPSLPHCHLYGLVEWCFLVTVVSGNHFGEIRKGRQILDGIVHDVVPLIVLMILAAMVSQRQASLM